MDDHRRLGSDHHTAYAGPALAGPPCTAGPDLPPIASRTWHRRSAPWTRQVCQRHCFRHGTGPKDHSSPMKRLPHRLIRRRSGCAGLASADLTCRWRPFGSCAAGSMASALSAFAWCRVRSAAQRPPILSDLRCVRRTGRAPVRRLAIPARCADQKTANASLSRGRYARFPNWSSLAAIWGSPSSTSW